MADKQTQERADESNTIKDPENWTTGDEPMTGAQRSYLSTLSEEAGEEFNENLTKAEASIKIEELQEKTGRGVPVRRIIKLAQERCNFAALFSARAPLFRGADKSKMRLCPAGSSGIAAFQFFVAYRAKHSLTQITWENPLAGS